MPDQTQYHLSRDKQESARSVCTGLGDRRGTLLLSNLASRLEKQHELWTDIIGYKIHPSIAPLLTKADAHLAEFATGTGIWLREVGPTLSPTAQLVGLDISTEQFPPETQLPGNLELATADVINTPPEKLPAKYLNRFDALHVRLLVGALPKRELWVAVARNALAVLRPGGALQWEDGDFTWGNTRIRTTKPGGSTAAINARWQAAHESMGGDSRFDNARHLDDIFRAAGFESVEQRHFNVGRAAGHERQQEWAGVQGGAMTAIYRVAKETGRLPDGWTEEKEKQLDVDEVKEYEEGGYFDWDIVACVGFKPKA